MKAILAKILDIIFVDVLSYVLNIYERWFMYRIKEAWGKAHVRKVKVKGRNFRMVGYSRITDPDKLSIGDNVRIGYGAFLFCKGGITIGNNCILSRNVIIYSANHDYESTHLPFNDSYVSKEVVIEDNVWIGMGVMILPGVTIGEGSVIAMGSVISKSVPKYSVVGSSKQTVLKERDLLRYKENVENQRFFSAEWPDK